MIQASPPPTSEDRGTPRSPRSHRATLILQSTIQAVIKSALVDKKCPLSPRAGHYSGLCSKEQVLAPPCRAPVRLRSRAWGPSVEGRARARVVLNSVVLNSKQPCVKTEQHQPPPNLRRRQQSRRQWRSHRRQLQQMWRMWQPCHLRRRQRPRQRLCRGPMRWLQQRQRRRRWR